MLHMSTKILIYLLMLLISSFQIVNKVLFILQCHSCWASTKSSLAPIEHFVSIMLSSFLCPATSNSTSGFSLDIFITLPLPQGQPSQQQSVSDCCVRSVINDDMDYVLWNICANYYQCSHMHKCVAVNELAHSVRLQNTYTKSDQGHTPPQANN